MNPMFDERFINQYLDKQMLPAEIEVFEGRLKKERVLQAALNAEKRARGIEVNTEPENAKSVNNRKIEKPMEDQSTIKKQPIAWGAALSFALLIAVAVLYWYYGI